MHYRHARKPNVEVIISLSKKTRVYTTCYILVIVNNVLIDVTETLKKVSSAPHISPIIYGRLLDGKCKQGEARREKVAGRSLPGEVVGALSLASFNTWDSSRQTTESTRGQ